MTTQDGFQPDAGLPDHKRAVAQLFYPVADYLITRYATHPGLASAMGRLMDVRDECMNIAQDVHRDTAGHPGGGAAAKAASHEPVPLAEQGTPDRSSAAMADTTGGIGGEPTEAPMAVTTDRGDEAEADRTVTVKGPDTDGEGGLRHGNLDSSTR